MIGFDRFTDRAQEAATRAYELMLTYKHTQLDIEHVLLALLQQEDSPVREVLDHLEVDTDALMERVDALLKANPHSAGTSGTPSQVYITPRVKRLMERADEEASKLKAPLISTEHLMLTILAEPDSAAAKIMQQSGVDYAAFQDAVAAMKEPQPGKTQRRERRFRTLEKYSRDLTRLAKEGRLDPVIGRDAEIMRVLQVLSRRTKNNPVLIGEAGVGKTAIVEGLAANIVAGDVPETLMNKRVVSLDLGSMLAGARFRGEFEERLDKTLKEIQKAKGEVILFIDELHIVVGAGAAQGALDASNMMKPALSRGELRCIGATTFDEYRQHIESDAALERRFAPVYIEEPSIQETIEMLRGIKSRYEEHHQVAITDEALVAAARHADRYVKDRRLPDKAIDLIDEAGAKLRIAIHSLSPELKEKRLALRQLAEDEDLAGQERNYERAAELRSIRLQREIEFSADKAAWQEEHGVDEVVDERDVAAVVAQWTGIPVSRMQETETQRLLEMEQKLGERVIGQDAAIEAVADAIRRARSGLKDPQRPIGSFIFLGSSGVGKTELAKALAQFMFDDQEALIQIDMSEFGERHTVSRLVGAPPGYVGYDQGGQLTEAVRRRPYQVILFDEIEKAHPDVWNALLQILEEGHLTDGHGRVVDFRNTVIIMTSNLGTTFVHRGAGAMGFSLGDDGDKREQFEDDVAQSLKRTFRPEFINRIDEVIVFNALRREDVMRIVDLQMRELEGRLAEQGLRVELSDAARGWLADQGYDETFGARPLRRTIQRYVESPLSKRLLRGDFDEDDTVRIDVDAAQGTLSFECVCKVDLPTQAVEAQPEEPVEVTP